MTKIGEGQITKKPLPEINVPTSIRLPYGFKDAVQKFLIAIREKTGATVTLTEFIVTACEFYLKYLVEGEENNLEEKMREFVEKDPILQKGYDTPSKDDLSTGE